MSDESVLPVTIIILAGLVICSFWAYSDVIESRLSKLSAHITSYKIDSSYLHLVFNLVGKPISRSVFLYVVIEDPDKRCYLLHELPRLVVIGSDFRLTVQLPEHDDLIGSHIRLYVTGKETSHGLNQIPTNARGMKLVGTSMPQGSYRLGMNEAIELRSHKI